MPSSSRVTALRRNISSTLDGLIPVASAVAIVDFPNHPNVGDSAIYLGEMEYLRRRKCSVLHVCDWQTYDARVVRRSVAGGILLIHGGGNFGDLYPVHQELRQAVLRDFRDHRIVQLPQSVHFDDPAAWDESRALFSAHPDFHLIVRDQASLELVRRGYDTPTHLCPDMAFMLDLPPFRSAGATLAAVVLSRTDGEKTVSALGNHTGGEQVLVADWLDEPTPRDEWLYRWATQRAHWQRTRWPHSSLAWAQRLGARRMAEQRVERGIRLIHRGRTLVTDRLHALILGWMSGMPVFHVDNRYRKLGNVLDTWLPGHTDLPAFDTLDDALRAASVE